MTAVRAPEYLPRLSFAALLLAADRVVLGDTFRFSRQSAQNRARIRTSQGTQWLSVPRVHAGAPRALGELAILDDGWRVQHARAVRVAYGMAPFYEHYAPSLAALWAEPAASLASLTVASVRWVGRQLDTPCAIERASDLPGAPATLDAVWRACDGPLLTLAESLARDRQLGDALVELAFQEPVRRQTFPGFEPGLSVLDLLMNYGPASADMLRDATTLRPVG